MKCKHCDGTGTTKGWISEPCAYCGGTGELPNDFSEITNLKRCKKCGGEAVFSGVFDDPPTYRFPECMKCGARAEGNSTKDSWYERARKWNKQNTETNEEWFDKLSTEEKAMVIICCCPYESDWFGDNFEKRIEQKIKDISKATYGYEYGVNKIKNWLKQPHKPNS